MNETFIGIDGTGAHSFGANTFNIALQPRNADGSSWSTTIAGIEKAYKAVYPNDDFDYSFVDESIAKFYTAEKNTGRLLGWATGLAIFLSCLGLLGLVIYITNQRTKEIGIRKVIGASVGNLMLLLSRDFLKPIGLAVLIALPISWWGSHKWLENFAYKTSVRRWRCPFNYRAHPPLYPHAPRSPGQPGQKP
jgi:putative ABC transport system permease protein